MAEIITNEYFANNITFFKNSFSKIRLIALDLDGTLLDNYLDLDVGEDIFRICKLLYEKYQVYTIIATGRTLSGAKSVRDSLISNINVPLVLYNGSVVIHNNTYNILEQKFIDFNTTSKIINTFKLYENIQVFCYYYIDNILNTYEIVKGYSINTNDLPKKDFNGHSIEWYTNINDNEIESENILPSAILIDISTIPLDDKVKIKTYIEDIDTISMTASTSSYIEIRPRNSNKGLALKTLADYYQIKNEEILSIGDNDNDIEMLEYSGIGVTVSSASKRAKESSDFITLGGAYKGVFDILKKIIDIKSHIKD